MSKSYIPITNLSNVRRDAIKEVLRGKTSLLEESRNYNKKYEEEIALGTEKKRLLLENGKKQGLRPDQVNLGPVFIPSEDTPILNYLAFSLRDDPDGLKSIINVLREDVDLGKSHEELKDKYENKVGHMHHAEVKTTQKDIGNYLYGDVTLEIFEKIKKLKILARSPNDNEAFSAYKKCRELCEKHGLNIDLIRTEV